MHDAEAERVVRRSLEVSAETGYSTRGGNVRFRIIPGPILTDYDLLAYCSEWMDVVNAGYGPEAGWRPRVDANDKTVIQIASRELASCQGRAETVKALSVIAAGFACRISPQVVMALPSAAVFWDWIERHRIKTTRISRPVSAMGYTDGKRVNFFSCQSWNSVTSEAVVNYEGVFMNERWLADVAIAEEAMREVDMRYIRPSLAEADRLVRDSYSAIMSNYDGQAHLRTDMQHGSTITNGQMLRYCKLVWHDSEVYQLGTRWRPAHMPNLPWSRGRKENRGGISLPDQWHKTAIGIDGSPAMCQGLAPVLAGMRIRLDPEILKKTEIFHIFYSFLDFTPGISPVIPRVVSDIDPTPRWPQIGGRGDQINFQEEEMMMSRVMTILMAEYSRTLGQFHGACALPKVVWSREDFVNHLMTWWPEAEIHADGRFRYVPNGLEKGGLEIYETGDSFACQGKSAWQGALMAMTASLICGIPAPIAALVPSSNVFWNQIANEFGPDAVLVHRKRLENLRSPPTVVQDSPLQLQAMQSSSLSLGSTDCFTPSALEEAEISSRISDTFKVLSEYSRATKGLWMEAQLVPSSRPLIEVAKYLTTLGKTLVGAKAPDWNIVDSSDSCIFECHRVGFEFFFFSNNSRVGSKSCSPALLELLAAVACNVPPVLVTEDDRFSNLIDVMVQVCLGDVEDVASLFSKQLLEQVKVPVIEFDPPKRVDLFNTKKNPIEVVKESETHFFTLSGNLIDKKLC